MTNEHNGERVVKLYVGKDIAGWFGFDTQLESKKHFISHVITFDPDCGSVHVEKLQVNTSTSTQPKEN